MIQTASQQQMKLINTQSVFKLIQYSKSISRADIAKLTKLSPTTISTIVEDLIARGMIMETSLMKKNGAGRKAINLEINNKGKYIIGMNLDHQSITGTFFNLKCEPLFTVTERYRHNHLIREELPNVFAMVIHKLIQTADLGFDKIIAACIGISAVLDSEKKSIVLSTPLNVGDIDLHRKLSKQFDFPIFMENETTLAATDERKRMNSAESPFIYLMASDGLGVSVIINNEHLQGKDGLFLEMGHMSLQMDGPLCSCGNRGCFELYVSVPALVAKVREYEVHFPDSIIYHLAEDKDGRIDEQTVARALATSDPLAETVVREMGICLGNGLVNLIHIFNPGTIVIGGKLAILGDKLLQPALTQVKQRSMNMFSRHVDIVLSLNSRVSNGAAVYALNKVLEAQFN